MKSQNLFSGKNKNKYFSLSYENFTQQAKCKSTVDSRYLSPMGLSKTLGDNHTSIYQICEIEENN